jgi:hypothetical protein
MESGQGHNEAVGGRGKQRKLRAAVVRCWR